MSVEKWSSKERRLIVFAASVALACLFFLANDHILLNRGQNPSEKIGKIDRIEKDVRQKSAHLFSWKNLRGPNSLHLGDSIFTGEQSETEITLDSGDRVTLGPNSLVTFSGVNGQLQLDLKYGKIISQTLTSQSVKVVQQSEAPPQIVENILWKESPPEVVFKDDLKLTLSWTSPLRPSAFQVEMARDENFKKILLKFKTQKTSFTSSNFPREGAFFTRVTGLNSKGQKTMTSNSVRTIASLDLRQPAAVEPELPQEPPAVETPTVLAIPQLQARTWSPLVPQTKSLKISWSPVEKTQLYELEASRFADFRRSSKIQTTETFHTWPLSDADPVYFRVRAVLDDSIQSGQSPVQILRPRTSVAEYTFQDRYEIIAQTPDEAAPPIDVPLIITNPIAGENFKVSLSKFEDLRNPTEFLIETKNPQLTIPEPGTFYFTIQSVGKNGQPLAKPSPRSRVEYVFIVPLAQPELLAPAPQMTFFYQNQKDSAIDFSWSPVRQADSYLLQISDSSDFSKLLESKILSATNYSFQPQVQGKFYWRVKATSSENRESSWSQTQDLSYYSGRTPAGR